jgi:hypothetical protein
VSSSPLDFSALVADGSARKSASPYFCLTET